LLALLCVAAASCGGENKVEISKRTQAKIDLPAKPRLAPPAFQRQHSDGVLTVEGLLRERDAHLGRDVEVRGKVKTLSLCDRVETEPPPVASPNRQAPHPKARAQPEEIEWNCHPQPYALLVDQNGDGRHELRIGGQMTSRLASLKVGQVVDLKGTFDIVSPNRKYVDQRGLLFLP
jgi:hypothetical protein